MPEPAASVQEYIAALPEEVRPLLEDVRGAIRRALPDGEERIRYGMPAIMLNERYAIHFAGWKKHIGLYPVSRLEGELEERITPYRAKKDSVNFPYSKPVPLELITEVAAALRDRLRA